MKNIIFTTLLIISLSLISGCFDGSSSSSSASSSASGSCSVGSDCTPSNLSAVPASS
ncbi:hypothetical protein L3V82_00445 [Thiotrichales bacterium 19S3-7]|nr:hypothetical protein [Thiotrichales bacterium 19S3-7]MCF6800632.1 hypothetical protein [Thiotrichales bacterium 19S3-11]